MLDIKLRNQLQLMRLDFPKNINVSAAYMVFDEILEKVWSVHGQMAGYIEKYINDYFPLTNDTVKGTHMSNFCLKVSKLIVHWPFDNERRI